MGPRQAAVMLSCSATLLLWACPPTGEPTGAPIDSGSGLPDGGEPDAGLDAGTDPSVTLTTTATDGDCAGVLPTLPTGHLDVGFDVPMGNSCQAATVEGAGKLALRYGDATSDVVSYQTFDSSGSMTAAFSGSSLAPLVGVSSGFHGALQDAGVVNFSVFTGAGAPGPVMEASPADTSGFFWTLAADPSGSQSLFFERSVNNAGNHFFNLTARRATAAGAWATDALPIADGQLGDRPMQLSAALNTDGQSVLVWDFRNDLRLKWFAATGMGQGQEGDVGLMPAPIALAPLYGGNVALRRNATWTSIFEAPVESTLETGPPPVPVVSAAPAWLAALTATDLTRVRMGNAYAAASLPSSSVTPCAHTVQLVSRTGRTCGTLVFKWKDATCAPRNLTIGLEGTVVQQSPDDGCSSSSCHCEYHVWPAFLH